MINNIGFVIVGVVAVVTTAYHIYWYIRKDQTPQISPALRVLGFLLIAALTYFPVIGREVNVVIHLSTAALFISNVCSTMAAYYCNWYFLSVAIGEHATQQRFRWMRVYVIATLLAMVVFWWRAGQQITLDGIAVHGYNRDLLVYRLLYVCFLTFVVTDLTRLWLIERQYLANMRSFKLATTVFLIGSIFSYLWLGLNIPLAYLPLSDSHTPLLRTLLIFCFFGIIGCDFSGGILPYVQIERLRLIWIERALYPLWRDLADTKPSVVLPLPDKQHLLLLPAQTIELRVRRHVIEILDVWRLLTETHYSDLVSQHTRDLPSRVSKARIRQLAGQDALTTLMLLHQETRTYLSMPTVLRPLPSYRPDDFWGQVRYLEMVAHRYRHLKMFFAEKSTLQPRQLRLLLRGMK